jgi:signal peptidase I
MRSVNVDFAARWSFNGAMNRRERARALVRDYLESLVIAVVLALIIRLFILTAYKIPTGSMWPTLQVGDFVFAYKLPYGLRLPFGGDKWFAFTTPQRGEVVVFRYPNDESLSYIKRVVAVPGDKIEVRKRRLFINDQPAKYTREPLNGPGNAEQFVVLQESILGSERDVTVSKSEAHRDFGPEVVPPGSIFVMGDNRDSSDDSRYWGMIPVKNVDGHVFAVWLSLDWQKSPGGFPAVRWNRLLAPVH